jgi:hypothetical protein
MQYCPKCKINIRGSKCCCPLCQGKLQGEPEGEPFAVLPEPKVSGLSFFKLITFIVVCAELLLGFLRYLLGPTAPVAILSIIAIVAWADLLVMSWFRNNIMKTMVVQIYILMVLIVISDVNTGNHGWSLAWVLPIAFVLLAYATVLVARSCRIPLETYVMYLFWNVLLSFLQIIGIAVGANPYPLPAVASILLLVVLGAAVVIFRFNDLKRAAGKWFNL